MMSGGFRGSIVPADPKCGVMGVPLHLVGVDLVTLREPASPLTSVKELVVSCINTKMEDTPGAGV
jgi:hypothetical protein